MEILETCVKTARNNSSSPPWPFRDIVIGASVPVVLVALTYGLFHLGELRYRPWLFPHFQFFILFLSVASLLLYPLYLFNRHKLGLSSLFGFPLRHRILREFLISLLISFLVSLSIGLGIKIIELISKTKYPPKEFGNFPNDVFFFIFLFFGFTVVPVCEEVFFRGFLYNALKTRVSVVVATLIQGAFFGILHYPKLVNAFVIFLLGIVLAIVYEKRKTLISAILIHGMINALVLAPLLIVALQNIHSPATNWDEAKTYPSWFKSSPPAEIEMQKDGMQQWRYAIDTWGSKGSKNWKKEARAFNAVRTWFPEDRPACAKAMLGIVAIYRYYLSDYRRAVNEADCLLSEYPDQKEQCAMALAEKGWSYYLLKDFGNSRLAFTKVANEFSDYPDALKLAQRGIEGLDFLERK